MQGAPIWSRTFQAAGMAPTVIAYNEVYNAIQNGVIAAGENEAAGVEQMKFYEVAPPFDDAARDHDPAAVLLRQDVQEARRSSRTRCSRPARKPAPTAADRVLGRRAEARQDGEGGQAQARAIRGARPDEEAADPVMAAYAKVGAEQILAKINSDQVTHGRGNGGAARRRFFVLRKITHWYAGCCRGCWWLRWRS